MDDDSETEKINNILSSNYYHTLPLPFSRKIIPQILIPNLKTLIMSIMTVWIVILLIWLLIDEVLINKPYMGNNLRKKLIRKIQCLLFV